MILITTSIGTKLQINGCTAKLGIGKYKDSCIV